MGRQGNGRGSLGAALAGLVLAGTIGSAAAATPAPEPIVLGGGFGLTGALAPVEAPIHAGVVLAVEELNAAGGLLGRPVTLVVRDSGSDAATAAANAGAAVREDRVVAYLGYGDTDPVLAAGPVLQAAGIPMLTPGATAPFLPEVVGDLLFLAAFGDDAQAAAGTRYALARFGPRLALLWDPGVIYTRTLATGVRETLADGGLAPVLDRELSADAAGRAAAIAEIADAAPDAVYLAAMPADAGPLVRDLRAAGVGVPIVAGDSFDTPDLRATAGAAAEGVHFTTHAFLGPAPADPALAAFAARYTDRWGRAPESAFAALGHDAVTILAAGIAAAGSTDGSAVRSALEGTAALATLTGTVTYGPGVHVPAKDVTIVRIVDGGLEVAAVMPPTTGG